jgi:hypothetical protein
VKKTSNRAKSSGNKIKEIKTFTYFIPAPPHRKNGYREKEFDKIMQGILQSGFELVDLQTQAMESGMFVLAVLKVPSKKIAKIDEHLDMQDKFKLRDSHSSPDIELDEADA